MSLVRCEECELTYDTDLTDECFCEIKECNHNSQRDKYWKTNYLKWFEFADNEIDNGRKQTRCPKCFKWLFPSEF